MADKRITDLTTALELTNTDFMAVDNTEDGTRKFRVGDLIDNVEQYVDDAVDAETSVRESADTALGGRIDSEATARANADNQLASGIGKQMNNLADFYSTTTSYVVGDVCILQSGELMRCIAPTSGTFDNTKWEQITVDELISDEASARTTAINNEAYYRSMSDIVLSEDIAEPYDTTKSYVVGDIVSYNLYIYRCTGATTGTWDASKWEQVTVEELFDALNFSADAISYDNTSSGLESDNVQDAIDETITKLSAVGSASGDIATFNDGSELSMPKLEVAIEPVQDLHGYDAPWVGGAGKNKFQTTATSKTQNGVTWTVNNDGTITVSGSATDYTDLILGTAKVTTSMGKVTISGISGTTNIAWNNIALRDANNNVLYLISGGGTYASFTVDLSQYPTADNIVIGVKRNNNSTVSGTIKPQVELGQAVTTFAPYSNICPISGWDEVNVSVCGTNQWDEEWEVGGINHTTGQNTETTGIIRSKNYIMVKGNTNYNFLKKTNGIDFHVHWYDADKNFISYEEVYTNNSINYKVATSPQNAVYMRFNLTAGYGATYNNDISINYPSTDTSYHAYNGTTYTIDLDGTRYGGKVDLVSGVMTVDRVEVNMGSLSWGYSAGTQEKPLPRFEAILNNGKTDASTDCISSQYKPSLNPVGSRNEDATMCTYNSRVYICDSRYTDATAFKTAVNGVQLVYELATPFTIQLTPTVVKSLRGMNNVYADCGEILDAEYIRDLTAIIDYILEQLGN